MKKLLLLSFGILLSYFGNAAGHIDSVVVTPTPICAGSAITVKIYFSGSYSTTDSVYSFLSNSGGNSYSTTSIIGRNVFNAVPVSFSYTLPSNLSQGNYTVFSKDTISGNQVDTFSNIIVVNALPTVGLGSVLSPICQGGTTAALGGSFGGGATSAVWSDGGAGGSFSNNGGSTPSTATYTASSSSSSPVTLTITSGGGSCGTASANKSLTVNPNPTASAGIPVSAICQGGTTAALDGSFGGGATSAVWSDGGAGGSFTNNGGATPSSTTYTSSASSGSPVTLTLTTSGGSCGTATATKSLTVNANPTVNAGSSLSAICQSGTTAALGGSFGGGATSAVWSDGGAGGSFTNNGGSTPGTATYTASSTSGSPVTLTLTTSGGSCGSVSANKSLTVNPGPSANAGSPASICTGSAHTLTGSTIGGGASTGTWSITGVTGSMTNASSQLSNTSPTANPALVTFTSISPNNGTVTLTLTTDAPAPCGAASSSVVLTINPLATADAGTPKSVCQGGTITLAGSRGGSATGSTWSAPSGTFGNASFLNSTYTPSITSGNVTLTLTTSGPCAPAVSTVVITVNPTASIDAGSALTAICQGGTSAPLGGIAGGSATGGTWSDGGVGGTFNPNATALNATWTPPSLFSGTATLTLTASGGNCGTPSAFKTQLVNPNASLTLQTSNSVQTFCIGVPLTDINYAIGGGGTGTTTTGLPAGVIGNTVGGTTYTISGTPTVTGTFNYTVTTSGICGPSNANGTITINPKPAKPVFLSTNPASVCFKQTGVNFGVTSQANINYIWSSANTNVVFHGKHAANCLIDFPTSGSPFDIYVTAINATGCRDSSIVSINATSTVPNPPQVILKADCKCLICLDNQQSSYQWGYDDAVFVSHDIAGATLQDFTPSGGIDPTRNYYVKLNSGGCNYKVYYNAPLGISGANLSWKIKLQPNPNSGLFSLNIEGNRQLNNAFIIDALGKQLFSLVLHPGVNNVDIQSLPNGIYFLQVINEGGNNQLLKFIINK